MKRFMKVILVTVCLFSVFGASMSFAAPQTNCPVMGGRVNPRIFADHDGKRVYFCCPPCVADFKADPEKYLEKLKEMGQEPRTI